MSLRKFKKKGHEFKQTITLPESISIGTFIAHIRPLQTRHSSVSVSNNICTSNEIIVSAISDMHLSMHVMRVTNLIQYILEKFGNDTCILHMIKCAKCEVLFPFTNKDKRIMDTYKHEHMPKYCVPCRRIIKSERYLRTIQIHR